MTEHAIKVNVPVRNVMRPFWDGRRFQVCVAHRRAGKTVAAVQRLVTALLSSKRPNSNYGYIAPQRNQAKRVAWGYLSRMMARVPGSEQNRGDLTWTWQGHTIQLYGADNPDSIRGGYFDGVVLDEVAQMPPDTWGYVVAPMLTDREGWAIFIGSAAGRNLLSDLYDQAQQDPDWDAMMLRASETGIIKPSELVIARRLLTANQYAQEYECSFAAAIRGSYWGALLEQYADHVREITPDPAAQYVTSWDIGVRNLTAIWVMMPYMDNAWAAVDYYEGFGAGVAHYAKWLRDNNYLQHCYRHYAPHDIANMDWSADAKRIDVAARHGIIFERVPRPPGRGQAQAERVQAGIDIIPMMYFHGGDHGDRAARVYRGRLALSLYHQAYNPRLDAFAHAPADDWTTHAADAFGCFAVVPESDRRPGRTSDAWDRDYDPNTGKIRQRRYG